MVYEVKEWEGTENQRTPLFMHLKLFDGLTGSDRHLLELGENISKLNLLKCTLNFKNINERINIYSLVRPEVVIRNFEMYSTGIHLVMTKKSRNGFDVLLRESSLYTQTKFIHHGLYRWMFYACYILITSSLESWPPGCLWRC